MFQDTEPLTSEHAYSNIFLIESQGGIGAFDAVTFIAASPSFTSSDVQTRARPPWPPAPIYLLYMFYMVNHKQN